MKLKQKIKSYTFEVMTRVLSEVTYKEFPDLNVAKIVNFWINVLEWFFKISTAIIFTLAFTWWFPQYIRYETIITILLCLIIIELRTKNE